ncbi:MAG TPA: PaaI family thioesterase [Candidatus Limiplasma sp.]|nr:PaaI family thioesterase [Candidatus Limiplasma sp.]
MTLEEARTFFDKDYFATGLCGIHIDSLEPDGAVLSMPITTMHLNGNGVVQGGAIYTLADTAFAVAANAYGTSMVNRSADITYLKPGKGSVLYAKASCIARGAKMGLYRVEILDENQTLIAYMAANGFTITP